MGEGVYIGPRIPEDRFSDWTLVEPGEYGSIHPQSRMSSDYTFKLTDARRRQGVHDAAASRACRRIVDGVVVAKQCSTCGKVRAIFDYHKHPTAFDGHMSRCKDCENARQRERYRRKGRTPTRKTPCRKPEAT
jgi:hypothetical protein